MRLRHVLLTCVTLPLLATAIHPASADAVGGRNVDASTPMTHAEVEASRAAVRRMAGQLDLGFREFTLPNGLRVMVYTDHGTPVVHVGIWYDVGSKHEPAGRSGFAHLFEHLMFNGSQNVPGDYLPRLVNVGGEVNGNTSVDRTHYYETVPTPALDRALFMESDRMGHLLGGLSQATLDRQRGVVQNEKRNGSSAASAVVSEMKRAALYPAAHPYGHSAIGSMKDLNAATLDDVGAFFKEHYGPNNALLVLSGDVDLETARRLVTKYFGDIPAGPRNVRPDAGPVMLTNTLSQTTTAPVTAPLVVRAWPVPGVDSNEALALNVAAVTMAGMPGSPFHRHLVEEQKLFQNVSAANNSNAQAGDFSIGGTVRPGVDPKVAAAALDRELALFLKQGPSPDLMTQWIATNSYGSVRGLEVPSVRASSVGEGVMLSGRPDALKADLGFYAGLTPAAVTAVARKWLTRPRWELTVTPGPRVIPKDDAGIDGSSPADGATDGTPRAVATAASEVGPAAEGGNRGPVPDVGPPAEIRFPRIEHAKLANGIPVIYARWSRTPFTRLGLIVQGGALNEPAGQTGTLNVMYSLLAKSFAGMSEDSVLRHLNLTGISLSSGSGWTDGNVSLDTSDANLTSALTMMHQTLVAPTFPAGLIERMKQDMRDGRVSSRLDPQTLTREAMMPLLDAGSPYYRLQMYGDGKAYQRITRDGVLAAWHRWLRPEHAFMTVVSDKPLAELLPMLDRTVGAWKVAGPPEPVPDVAYQPRPGKPEIVLIDLPGAVQATITGGQWVPATDRDPIEALNLGDSIFGATNTSRLYTNLRDSKHWTYGANGSFDLRRYSSSYTVTTDVQQDKAGPAIGEMMEELRGIVGRRPITAAELDREKATKLGLAGRIFSDGGSVAGALSEVQERGLPDDYQAKIAARIRAVTLDDVNRAMRSQLDPSRWSWVIVGNASIIRPQLDGLGLPVRVVKAADVLPPR